MAITASVQALAEPVDTTEIPAGELQFTRQDDCNANVFMARITDIATGKGIEGFSLDPKEDKIPPCGGSTPTTPIIIGAYPLLPVIPQLVKIITEGPGLACSGALIANNAVITAGHCVFPKETRRFVSKITVIPGYNGTPTQPFGSRNGVKVLTFDGWTAEQKFSQDIAVIVLNAALDMPAYNPYGLAAFNGNCGNPIKLYFRPHYNPAIQNNQAQAQVEGPIVGCNDGLLVAALPSGKGSSGSGVVDRYSRAVFAVHSATDDKASYEATLTKAKICAIYHMLEPSEPKTNCTAGN